MAHLDALRVTGRTRCVIEHVDVVALDKLRLESERGLAAGFAHLIEREDPDLELVLGALYQSGGIFIGVKQDNILDKGSHAFLT